jgi:hypothetical protein
MTGKTFDEIFPGIAAVNFTSEGSGPKLSLRISKKEGIPVHLVHEGTPGATVLAVKRVDDLGFYSLGHNQLAAALGLSPTKTTAAVRMLNLRDDSDCHKEIVIGKSRFNRYSPKAIERINALLQEKTPEQIWLEYKQLTAKVGASPRR